MLIKTPANTIDIRYVPFSVTGNQVFRVCIKGLQSDGTINTLSEKIYWRNLQNILQIGYNLSLIPPNYDVVGYTNGNEVFRVPFNNRHYNPVPDPNPDPNPYFEPTGLVFAIIGAVLAVATITKIAYDVFSNKYTRTITIDHGNGIKTTTTKEWTDPPVETYVVNGNNYDCEVIGVEFNESQQISSPHANYVNFLFEITAANINEFEIEDEIV